MTTVLFEFLLKTSLAVLAKVLAGKKLEENNKDAFYDFKPNAGFARNPNRRYLNRPLRSRRPVKPLRELVPSCLTRQAKDAKEDREFFSFAG